MKKEINSKQLTGVIMDDQEKKERMAVATQKDLKSLGVEFDIETCREMKGHVLHAFFNLYNRLNRQNEIDEEQKIEIGRKISEYVSFIPFFDNENFLEVAEMAISEINKIKELKSQPGKYQISDEKRHTCGTCNQTYPVEILGADFTTCHNCISAGKVRPECQDKNGKTFYSGTRLKSEHSNTWLQVFQINNEVIVSDKLGAVDREDFVRAGWIVHERVTGYGPHGPICKFDMDVYIGSNYCLHHCFNGGDYDDKQQWVICELYNKE